MVWIQISPFYNAIALVQDLESEKCSTYRNRKNGNTTTFCITPPKKVTIEQPHLLL
jgi:hypothetical protein